MEVNKQKEITSHRASLGYGKSNIAPADQKTELLR
jgi:hypothetical protein